MKCALCNNSTFKTLFKVEHHIIEECTHCTLARTKNFKLPNYQKYHRDDQYQSDEVFFRNIFAKRYAIISKYAHKGAILDIGAANGVLLDIFFENGWKTYGIEPSGSAEISKAKGHVIENNSLHKTKFKPQSFDVIVINHVLEHVIDPVSFLNKAKSLLKDTGIMYIDVPNFGSLSAQIAGRNWKYILPEEHVHHFTPQTLKLLVNNTGYKTLHFQTRSGIYETQYPMKYLLDELFAIRKNLLTDLITIPGNTFATLLQRGSSMGCIIKRI